MSYLHHNRCPRHRKHQVPYGFSILSDLVPLFHMADDFRRKPLSPQAKKRLAWFDQYRQSANVALTCRHFGISKTFYYWQKRFDPSNLASLEERDCIPRKNARAT